MPLCLIDKDYLCLQEKCRYYIKNECILQGIDRSGYPSLDERLKNGEVHKDEPREMPLEGPGNIQA